MFRRIFSKLSLADIVLLISLTLFSVLFAMYGRDTSSNKLVRVYKDHRLVGEYSLNDDREIRIDAHNLIEIKDGKVSMKDADCPDKRCVKQGSSSYLPIICMPNHVVVEIVGAKDDPPLILQ